MSETPTNPEQEQNQQAEPGQDAPAAKPATRAEARANRQGEQVAPEALPAQSADLPADASNPHTQAAGGASPLTPIAPEAPSQARFETSPALDERTYTAIKEPRAEGRLALDGVWHQISPKYLVSQLLQSAIFIVLLLGGGFLAWYVFDVGAWVWIPVGALALFTVIPLTVLPRQVRALGYMLREDDIVFRKGILWQRMVAVPYGRLQLVDISHGPMDRGFGIAKLKLITAAATTGVEIPGLSQQAAEALRDALIEVAEERRTGL